MGVEYRAIFEICKSCKNGIRHIINCIGRSAPDVIAGFKKDTAKWGPVADSYARMFDWIQYAMIESPVAGYDPVRALMDTNLIVKVIKDPKADPKALLDAAVADSNKVLAENAPK